MAELPDLGKHCSMNYCNRLDFLPLCCEHCNKIYCKDHHSVSDHSCKKFLDKELHVVGTSVPESWKCPVSDCKDVCGVVHHTCQLCGVPICLKHRHEEPKLHSCPSLAQVNSTVPQSICLQDISKKQFKEAFSAVEEEINGKLQAASRGRKKEMANQLRLMRLKGRAIGEPGVSIPASSRAYFTVTSSLSHSTQESSLSVYVSKTWSLGRAIDSIEKMFNLNLKNNHKKRSFLHADKSAICHDMSRTIASLLEDGGLVDGETLTLEYEEQEKSVT